MARIFISYRRSDTGYVARMLADRLQRQYGDGSVFLDVDNIPPGVDFRDHLDAAVARCDVFLALIGNEWLAANESGGIRLQDPRDFVRIELESALQRNIPVIPILTESAGMPREDQLPESLRAFAYRNAMELRAGVDLEVHLGRIVKGVQDSLAQRSPVRTAKPVTSVTSSAASPQKAQPARQESVRDTAATTPPVVQPAGKESFLRWSIRWLFLLRKPSSLASRLLRLLFFLGLVLLAGFWMLILSLNVVEDAAKTSDVPVKLFIGGTATALVYLILWLPVVILEAYFRSRSAAKSQ